MLYDCVTPPGSYTVTWDGKNKYGLTVSSGVYIYTIDYGKFYKARKMMVIK